MGVIYGLALPASPLLALAALLGGWRCLCRSLQPGAYIFLPISAGNRAAAGGGGWEALKDVPSFIIILFTYFLFISPVYFSFSLCQSVREEVEKMPFVRK